MRNALLMLAAGLLSVRFLPALPPLWSLFVLTLIGLMCLPWRTYLLSFFLFGLWLEQSWLFIAQGDAVPRQSQRFLASTRFRI